MCYMMTFEPLWETMKKRNISTYKLLYTYGFSRGTLDRLKHDKNVTLEIIDRLCAILDCEVQDIVKHVNDEKKPK